MILYIGLYSFAIVFLLIIGLAALAGVLKHPIDERVDRIRHFQTNAKVQYILPHELHAGMVASLGQRVAPKDPLEQSESKRRLVMAGYYSRQAFYTYWGVKIALIVSLPVTLYLCFILQRIPTGKALLPAFFAIGLGMILPDFFLFWKKGRRHEQIFCGLPDALDLLVVCIEAGLGLDAAMQKVSEEFHLSNRVLSEELHITCAAVRLGQPRSEALHDLGERTGVSDLKALAAVLTQSDRFGTSLGQALRVHSDDMRTRRRQRAEELAAKTTVKLIFPLVLFIFPAIFVVLAGPAIIRILDTLVGKL